MPACCTASSIGPIAREMDNASGLIRSTVTSIRIPDLNFYLFLQCLKMGPKSQKATVISNGVHYRHQNVIVKC